MLSSGLSLHSTPSFVLLLYTLSNSQSVHRDNHYTLIFPQFIFLTQATLQSIPHEIASNNRGIYGTLAVTSL